MQLKLVKELQRLTEDIFTPATTDDIYVRQQEQEKVRQAQLETFKIKYQGLPEAIQELFPALKGGVIKWTFFTYEGADDAELIIESPRGTFAITVPFHQHQNRIITNIDVFPIGLQQGNSVIIGRWDTAKHDWYSEAELNHRDIARVNAYIKTFKTR